MPALSTERLEPHRHLVHCVVQLLFTVYFHSDCLCRKWFRAKTEQEFVYSEIMQVCKEIFAQLLIGEALDRPQEPGRLHFSQRLKRLGIK